MPSSKVTGRWLDPEIRAEYPEIEKEKEMELENKQIPVLSNYEEDPGEEFWKIFPRRELPKKAETRVNVKNFKKEVDRVGEKMSRTEKRRAEKILLDLKKGAEAYQKKPELPPVTVKNAESAFKYGRVLTDKIASWITKGFVAGPFDCPPVPGFRANPLSVIERNNKIRPVLNMSSPKGASYNDNIDKRKLEKVKMSTAKQFGQELRNCGMNARFSKFDICDAYKLIPAKPEDYRLQGFKWLGKYFCEIREIFGSTASVCNFDRLSNTRDLIVMLSKGTPRNRVFRVLDDTACVGPRDSESVREFTEEIKRVSRFMDIPLAKNCPDQEKAFECETRGVVLGIGFNSTDMTWFLSKKKADKVIRRCLEGAAKDHIDLKEVQKMMGSVNDIAQMCGIMKFHKGSGNILLGNFRGNENILLPVRKEVKEDLLILAKIVDSAREGLPIAAEVSAPPLSALTFYTDAAGASFTMVGGIKHFHQQEDRGVACVGGTSLEDIWIQCKVNWPTELITGRKDEKGREYGSKSTTLESIGLLLPFVAFPEYVRGRHVVFKVDNAAVVFGWQKGYVKNDRTASKVITCVGYLAGELGATVYVDHVARMSDEMAELADELSRRETAKKERIRSILEKTEKREVKGYLLEWLKDPEKEDMLCRKMLQELKDNCS